MPWMVCSRSSLKTRGKANEGPLLLGTSGSTVQHLQGAVPHKRSITAYLNTRYCRRSLS